MKKRHILLFGLLLSLLSISVKGNWLEDEWHTWNPQTPDTTGILIILGILAVAVVIGIALLISHSTKQEKQSQKDNQKRYRKALESLDKQLREGKITEETYKEFRKDLEEKYKPEGYE